MGLTSTTWQFCPALASTHRSPPVTVAPPGWSANRLVTWMNPSGRTVWAERVARASAPAWAVAASTSETVLLGPYRTMYVELPSAKPAAAEAPGKGPSEMPLSAGPRT